MICTRTADDYDDDDGAAERKRYAMAHKCNIMS